MKDITKLRNIGISAHIDSGKTTLTERILFYTGKIHEIHEVRGKDGVGAVMDNMDLEREKGITIASAATTVFWKDNQINIIDTPGHVDFTVEVERSLRVLDGAVLVICASSGVQSQSITVDRQMKRYNTPRLVFVNKMDRAGANPFKCVKQLKDKLGLNGVMMQIPIGAEDKFQGSIDLVTMKALYFEGEEGRDVVEKEIPENLREQAAEYREKMLDALSMVDDDLAEAMLEEQEIHEDTLHRVIRKGTLSNEIAPVYVGSAYKNKGVQALLDAVNAYLPSPKDREYFATKMVDGEETKVPLSIDPDDALVGMAFKLVDEAFGQVTYFRIYQGTARKADSYFNTRIGKKQRFSRVLRVHSDKREDLDEAGPGEIVAIMGLDCASGDTFVGIDEPLFLESMFVAEPVISLAVEPENRGDADKLGKALARFRKEDPTFRVGTDEESGETIISGMGELHLEIYIERIGREYKVPVIAGAPQVNYREAPTAEFAFDHKRKKQTGGSGQYGHIKGSFVPFEADADAEEVFVFESNVTGGRIPKEYIPAIEKGFREVIGKGTIAGFPVVGLKIDLQDGSYHDVDSSEMAFKLTAQECFREHFNRTKPALLEPVMKVEIECPIEFQGTVGGDISSRRGIIMGSESSDGFAVITAEVPLAAMFGYATDLRSATQGKGTYSMEFSRYARVPKNLEDEVVKARQEAELAKK